MYIMCIYIYIYVHIYTYIYNTHIMDFRLVRLGLKHSGYGVVSLHYDVVGSPIRSY